MPVKPAVVTYLPQRDVPCKAGLVRSGAPLVWCAAGPRPGRRHMPTHYQGKPEEVRALNAFIKLVRAAGSVLARTSRPLGATGLTGSQFGVLETLLHLGPLHQCDLARKHLQSGGNITMIVDNLAKAGLVRRERLAEDRRYVRVLLTDAGRARIEAIFPGQVRQITAQMSALTGAEQEELGRLCRKLGLAAACPEAEACADKGAKPLLRQVEA